MRVQCPDPNTCSVSIGGQEFPVENAVLTLPDDGEYFSLLPGGFVPLPDQTDEEAQAAADAAAKAKADADAKAKADADAQAAADAAANGKK